MWDPYAEFESTTLQNGLDVHVAHWPGRPWLAMGFLIHTGAEHDPAGLEGLAHFVEHLVFHNTVLPQNELNGFFMDNGGSRPGARTGYPFTDFCFSAPANSAFLERAFSIFGQMLFEAKIERSIERERGVIVGEFHREYPVQYLHDIAKRRRHTLYPGTWLERTIRPCGSPETIQAITQEDLQRHYDNHFTPKNMSVVSVGGMTLQQIVEQLSRSPFAVMKAGTRTPLPSPVTDLLPPSETRYLFEISNHTKTETPYKVGGYYSHASIPGVVNSRAIRILEGMLSDVLNEEIRERRAWAYAAKFEWSNFRHLYECSIMCSGLALHSLDEIEGVVEGCVASMADRQDFFEQKKRRALASNLCIDASGAAIRNKTLTDLAYRQRIITMEEYNRDLERVTMDDIRALLEHLRPERRWTLLVRP